MYAQISAFAIDKAMATIVEESGIAEAYIREYYRTQGKRVMGVEKNLGDYKQQRLYDLVDSIGGKWEVKVDRMAHVTGNFYLELQALEASEATLYLIFAAGKAYVTQKSALRDEVGQGYDITRGGDNLRSQGVKIPLERLQRRSEQGII